MKNSIFLHFLGKRPSVFSILDDPEAQDTLLKSMALELKPREADNGWSSYWESKNNNEEQSVKAAFAARRDKKKKT